MLRRFIACFALLAQAETAVALDWPGKLDEDRRALSHADISVRQRALERLSHYGDGRAADRLILKALGDIAPQIRHKAAAIAAQRGIRSAASRLVSWLAHPNGSTRLAAVTALGDLGDSSTVVRLTRLLSDTEVDVRLAAVNALGKLHSAGRSELIPLLGRLQDTSAKVRLSAVEVLTLKKDPRSVIPLMGRLNDSAQDVRIAAITALGDLGDRRAGPALVRLLRSPDQAIESKVIAALASLRFAGAVEPLIYRFRTGDTAMAEQCAHALAKIGTSHALQALVAGLADLSFRSVAAAALTEADKAAAPFIIELLKSPGTSRAVASAAVSIARRTRMRQAVPLLIEHFDREKVPQLELINALGRIGDPRGQRTLLALLQSPRQDLRLAALDAVGPMVDPRAAGILVALLDDTCKEVRLRAIQLLGRLRVKTAAPYLLRLAKSADPHLGRTAVAALALLKDARSVPVLVELLGHSDSRRRWLASQALTHTADPKSTEPILQVCRNSLGPQRVTCIQALGGVLRGRSHEEALQLLAELVLGTDRLAALAAIDALAALKGPQVTRTVVRGYPHLHPALEKPVLAMLGNQPRSSAETLPILLDGVTADEPSLRAAAAWSLGKLADRHAVAALLAAARDRAWNVRTNAAASLSRLAPEEARPLLRVLLKDTVPYVRANAVLGLGELNDDNAIETMLNLTLTDHSPWVRLNALRALKRLGVSGPLKATAEDADRRLTVNELIHNAAHQDPDARVRAAAKVLQKASVKAVNSWIGIRLLDYRHKPLRNTSLVLITPSGRIRATSSDSRAQLWEEGLQDGYCHVELAPAM